MKKKSYVPPFGKVFAISLILLLIGISGLAFIVFFFRPTLGPRWLFFFFLTTAGSGAALPASFLLQRRLATQHVPMSVLIREALWFGIFLDLLAWLQIGRIMTSLAIVLLGGGLILLEVFIRMAEKATFHADPTADA